MKIALLVGLAVAAPVFAQTPPLLPQKAVAALVNQAQVEAANRGLEKTGVVQAKRILE
jgi:hypothetical protein